MAHMGAHMYHESLQKRPLAYFCEGFLVWLSLAASDSR
jgi:hypothetical protein